MKRLVAFALIVGFATAVVHAVPYSTGFDSPKVELSKKKSFELAAFDMPVQLDVPAAPEVKYDLIVVVSSQTSLSVIPQSNSPPRV